MERNAREACEEREKADVAKAAQAEADAAAKAQADAAAKEQANAIAKVQEAEAAHSRAPLLVVSLRAVPPAPESQAPIGGAGDDQPVLEKGGGDPVILGAEVPPPTPTADAQTSRPDAPQVSPVGGELVVGSTPAVRTLVRRRAAKAASARRPLEVGAASSSAPEAEATSAAPPEWTLGGGTGVLNTAAQDVQARFQAQGAALQQYTQAFLATRSAVRDYHNIRAAAFNSHVQELAKRTTDLAESRSKHSEEERSKAAQECGRLVKELANQADRHKADLQKVKDNEANLQAEFETERSAWAEKEKAMNDGYGTIEDMIDEFFPSHAVAANQAIEARCDERRRVGAEIAPNAPRTLGEQLLAVQARLQPAHRMLRRLQRVGAQVLTAL
nr:uncharacterized abhydrolase domain-containing protein DDB_G0269086-like [Aegilops tauschii subsp. strangulata]